VSTVKRPDIPALDGVRVFEESIVRISCQRAAAQVGSTYYGYEFQKQGPSHVTFKMQ
jgi:hypothetical protein